MNGSVILLSDISGMRLNSNLRSEVSNVRSKTWNAHSKPWNVRSVASNGDFIAYHLLFQIKF